MQRNKRVQALRSYPELDKNWLVLCINVGASGCATSPHATFSLLQGGLPFVKGNRNLVFLSSADSQNLEPETIALRIPTPKPQTEKQPPLKHQIQQVPRA